MLRPALVLVILIGTGCNATVGNYFANRGRDFGDCWRLQVGGAVGLGGGVRLAGVADLGLGGGQFVPDGAFGWDFGRWTPSAEAGTIRERLRRAPGCDWYLGIHVDAAGVLLTPEGPEISRDHICFGLLPCLFSPSGTGFIWSESKEIDAWHRVHAFDVALSLYAGFVGVRAGFSPGEFLDFLLGWFGVDIAGDDRPLEIEKDGG